MSRWTDRQWPLADTLAEVLHTIGMNKLRTVATGFAMASGLFLVIVLQGAGNGIIHTLEHNARDFQFDAVHVFGGRTTMPHAGMREGRYISLDERDVDMVRRNFSAQVQEAMPVLERSGLVASRDACHLSDVKVMGVTPPMARLQAVTMLEGRWLNHIDIEQRRKVLVLPDRQASMLFPHRQGALGGSVLVGGVPWRVCGIYRAGNDQWETTFYAPYTTVGTIYARGRGIDRLSMLMKPEDSEGQEGEFEREYTRATSQIHDFSPKDESALWIWNQAEDSRTMKQAERIMHTAFWILGLLTMVSGVVGVSNIMLISVKERTREFGIRRAIGARPWSIVRMVMLESLVITLVFGYVGMVLGVAFCQYMDSAAGNRTLDIGVMQTQVFIDPTVDLSTCITATLIMVVCGTLAGFFPARKAVRMKPVDALRA